MVHDEGVDMTAKKVTLYSVPTCSECRIVKEFLNKNNVNYQDIDVSLGRGAVVKVSGQRSVPVTVVNGKAIVGFDTSVIREALEL